MKKKPLIFYFVVMALLTMAANFAHPVTPTLIIERGLSSSLFGTANAAVMVTMFLFAPLSGKLCQYVPTRLVMRVGAIGYAIGQAIFAMAQSDAMVFAGRMFAGMFSGAIFVAFSNYIVNTSEPAKRGQNLTILSTTQTVSSAAGYFVGGMLGILSVEAAFIAQVAVLLVCAALFFLVCEDDTPYKAKPERALTLRDANPFGAIVAARTFMTPMLALLFAIMIASYLGTNAFETSFNYYIRDQFGMGSAYNGTFKAIIAALTMLANSTICLYLQRKTDINRTFLPVTALCTLAILPTLLIGGKAGFIGAYITFSVINGIRMPLMQNMVASRTTPSNSNSVMGFYQAMSYVGNMIGALLAGVIYGADPLYPFALATIAYAAATCVAFAYVGKYRKAK